MERRPHALSCGLHLQPARRLVEKALQVRSREALLNWLMDQLRQPSDATRRRIALKLMQRYLKHRRGEVLLTPFLRLAAAWKETPAGDALLLYRLLRVDRVVACVTAGIFYPYFLQGRIPQGFGEWEFRSLNQSALFDPYPFITHSFVQSYLQSRYRITGENTSRTVLRILTRAGWLRARRMPSLRYHQLGYSVALHTLPAEALAFCLYEDLAVERGLSSPSPDQVLNAPLFRELLLPPEAAEDTLAWLLEGNWLREAPHGRGRRLLWQVEDAGALADRLLNPAPTVGLADTRA